MKKQSKKERARLFAEISQLSELKNFAECQCRKENNSPASLEYLALIKKELAEVGAKIQP